MFWTWKTRVKRCGLCENEDHEEIESKLSRGYKYKTNTERASVLPVKAIGLETKVKPPEEEDFMITDTNMSTNRPKGVHEGRLRLV